VFDKLKHFAKINVVALTCLVAGGCGLFGFQPWSMLGKGPQDATAADAGKPITETGAFKAAVKTGQAADAASAAADVAQFIPGVGPWVDVAGDAAHRYSSSLYAALENLDRRQREYDAKLKALEDADQADLKEVKDRQDALEQAEKNKPTQADIWQSMVSAFLAAFGAGYIRKKQS
jgi:hypothetical protein